MLSDNERYRKIKERAALYEEKHVERGYYFIPDHGETACYACKEKFRKKGFVRDGVTFECRREDPDWDRDNLPRCDLDDAGCGKILYGWVTMYGAREELAALEESFDIRNHRDCYLWTVVENTLVPGTELHDRLLAVAGITPALPSQGKPR